MAVEDLAARDPIVATKKDVVIGEGGKALCRLSPKLCPPPTTPIDEMAHYESFVKVRENMRWKWHFNKDNNPQEIENNFQKTPWYQKTDRAAPIARD